MNSYMYMYGFVIYSLLYTFVRGDRNQISGILWMASYIPVAPVNMCNTTTLKNDVVLIVLYYTFTSSLTSQEGYSSHFVCICLLQRFA